VIRYEQFFMCGIEKFIVFFYIANENRFSSLTVDGTLEKSCWWCTKWNITGILIFHAKLKFDRIFWDLVKYASVLFYFWRSGHFMKFLEIWLILYPWKHTERRNPAFQHDKKKYFSNMSRIKNRHARELSTFFHIHNTNKKLWFVTYCSISFWVEPLLIFLFCFFICADIFIMNC